MNVASEKCEFLGNAHVPRWDRDDLWIVSNWYLHYLALGLGVIEYRSGCEKIGAHVASPGLHFTVINFCDCILTLLRVEFSIESFASLRKK